MTKTELVEKIENGSDIMFSVLGRKYTVLTWTDDGIAIGEQSPNDNELLYFDTASELVKGFQIDGKTLAELAGQVIITQYT